MIFGLTPAMIDLLRRSLGAMPDEPIYQLPPDERGPEMSLKSEQLPDSRDWSHAPLKIEAIHAKNIKGRGVIVAICDTGIDVSHPDLVPNIAPSGHKDFTNSSTGYVDHQSHGTHVAGIVASAQGNGVGLIGIAPEAKVMAVKVLNDDGNGRSTWISNGIRHAADAGADIINLSLGGPTGDPQTRQAIQYAISKGCWVVCAAGNEGRDGTDTTSYPGHYPESIAVAAVDDRLERADFSTINRENDIAAPGVFILSTLPGNEYGAMSGTSMATPETCGCLALLRGELKRLGKPIPTQSQLLQTLGIIAGRPADKFLGFGLINPTKLLDHYLSVTPPPPPPVTPPPIIPPPVIPPPNGGIMDPVRKVIDAIFAQLRIAFAGNFFALMVINLVYRLVMQYLAQNNVRASDADALSVASDILNKVFDSLMARFSDPTILAILAIIRDVVLRLFEESTQGQVATWNIKCAA